MEIPPWLTPPNYAGIMESAARLSLGQRSQASKELEDAGRLSLQQQTQTNTASEAGDRLREAYAQLASNERIAAESQKSKQELAESALELRQQQADQLDAYRTGRLGQADTRQSSLDDWRTSQGERASDRLTSLNDWRTAQGDRADTRHSDLQDWRSDQGDRADASLEERIRSAKAREGISASRAAALIKGGQASAVTFPEFPGQTFIRQPSGAILKVQPTLHSPTVTLDPEGVPKTYTGRLDDPTIRGIMGTNAPASLQPSQPINLTPPPATGAFDFSAPSTGAGDALTLPSTGQTASVAPTDNTPAPAAAGGFVVVTNPAGKKVRIRSEQLDDALQQGYTR